MFKRLLPSVREYKKPTLLTLLFITLEAVIECLIPFITARLVNRFQAGAAVSEIVRVGALLVVLAALSLC